jgi:hypothetical protein
MSIGRRLRKLESALKVAGGPGLCRCDPRHVFIEREFEEQQEEFEIPFYSSEPSTECPRCGGAP